MAYFEFNFENPDNVGDKGKLFTFLKNVSLFVMVIALLIVLIPLDWSSANGQLGMVIFYNILIILMVTLPLLGLSIFFYYKSKKYFDYDYFIYGDVLKVVKIINKIKRKTIIDLNLHDVIEVGLTISDSFIKANNNVDKKYDLTCNRYDENLIYILSVVHGQKILLLCHTCDDFMIALHKTLKRESVFDKSVYTKKTKEEQI